MTRKIVVFTDVFTGITYRTPEFNGDRSEFLLFHGESSCDSCDADWDEIFKEFDGVDGLERFKDANIRAQQYYHSFLGDEILPVEEFRCAGKNIISESMGKAIWLSL